MKGFVTGLACGAGVMYAAMMFHLVRSNDGFHVIPKVAGQLKDTYVDIREFGFGDWKDHPELSAALVKADRADLMQGSATGALQRSLDGILNKDPS